MTSTHDVPADVRRYLEQEAAKNAFAMPDVGTARSLLVGLYPGKYPRYERWQAAPMGRLYVDDAELGNDILGSPDRVVASPVTTSGGGAS